jgi:ankyrin repeat protein
MKACHRGHVEIAKLLLEAGADANASDRDGITALMRAQKTGRQDLIELLLRYQDRPLVNSSGK